jgi:hypothetical protein
MGHSIYAIVAMGSRRFRRDRALVERMRSECPINPLLEYSEIQIYTC